MTDVFFLSSFFTFELRFEGMSRTMQRFAITIAITAVILAYLYHVPNSEGVPRMDRIRLLSASMKIVSFVVRLSSSSLHSSLSILKGFISETLGIAPAWHIQRNSGVFLKKIKKPEVITYIKVSRSSQRERTDRSFRSMTPRLTVFRCEFTRRTPSPTPTTRRFIQQ